MSNFGALTDHFDLTGSGKPLENVGVLVDSSRTHVAQSRADAQDQDGDIAASAFYGNTEGDLYEISNTYAIKSGTLNLNTLKLGLVNSKVALTLEASTSNTEWPQITVTGIEGQETLTPPTGKANTFGLPSITIAGLKRAQLMGFTISEGKLTGSSLSASIELSQQDDGEGEPVAHAISGGTIEISADFVRITDAPAWAVSSPFTETQAPGANEPQADFHTTSAAAAGTLVRDAS